MVLEVVSAIVNARPPVEAALEDNDIRFAGGGACQFDRAFQRLGTGVAEEESVNGRGDDRPQLGDQLQHRLVDDDIGLGVQEQSGLFTDGFDNLRMAVAGIGHANAAGEVKIFLSVYSINGTSFRTFRLDRENPRPDGRHVRKIFIIEFTHGIHLFENDEGRSRFTPLFGLSRQIIGCPLDIESFQGLSALECHHW